MRCKAAAIFRSRSCSQLYGGSVALWPTRAAAPFATVLPASAFNSFMCSNCTALSLRISSPASFRVRTMGANSSGAEAPLATRSWRRSSLPSASRNAASTLTLPTPLGSSLI